MGGLEVLEGNSTSTANAKAGEVVKSTGRGLLTALKGAINNLEMDPKLGDETAWLKDMLFTMESDTTARRAAEEEFVIKHSIDPTMFIERAEATGDEVTPDQDQPSTDPAQSPAPEVTPDPVQSPASEVSS